MIYRTLPTRLVENWGEGRGRRKGGYLTFAMQGRSARAWRFDIGRARLCGLLAKRFICWSCRCTTRLACVPLIQPFPFLASLLVSRLSPRQRSQHYLSCNTQPLCSPHPPLATQADSFCLFCFLVISGQFRSAGFQHCPLDSENVHSVLKHCPDE